MMKELFEKALGISSPWFIDNLEFDANNRRLDIHIDFEVSSKFEYNSEEENISGKFGVYDTVEKTWRHLNFFQHECYLNCRVPRVKPEDDKVRQIEVPWAGKSNGFTLLFEALLMQLCCEMPVNAVSRLTNADDNKIWRMLQCYIEEAREHEDFSLITKIGLDETSKRKHHDYVTLFVDLEQRKTVYVTEGKDHTTIKRFTEDLEAHRGQKENITDVSCDMSPAFIKGINKNLKNAKITFDKFHLVKIINSAVADIRKSESKENEILKGTRNIFNKNRENMTKAQLKYLNEKLELKGLRLKTVRAFHLRESFQEIYQSETKNEFISRLNKWYSWATHCRLKPMKEAAKTIKEHWDGVIRWYDSRINNGILEGLNSLIQSAKSKARGFKTFKNFMAVIYLVTGDLDFTKVNSHYQPLA
ncbi:MAG: transposase family protein [Ignavibacteria bacterium]|nr:MAG: transposase family protein [Ignavibacteria bacterium]